MRATVSSSFIAMRANVSRMSLGCGERIRLAVGPFRIDVDQAHLNGGERILQFPVAGVTLIAQPLAFRSPIDVFLRFPNVFATSSESKRLEPHRLQGAIAGQDHQVGPRNLSPYFCLIGHNNRRALSRLALSGQLLSGANRCVP